MHDRERRVLVVVALIGFAVNLIGGILGGMAPENSRLQLLGWRIGDTASVMAAVAASRYVGLRGYHVAAAGLVMLAIVHGIAAAGSGIEQVSNESVSLVIPLIPTLLLMWWCDLFPKWSRAAGVLLIALFGLMYYRIVFLELAELHWTTLAAFLSLGLLELCWASSFGETTGLGVPAVIKRPRSRSCARRRAPTRCLCTRYSR